MAFEQLSIDRALLPWRAAGLSRWLFATPEDASTAPTCLSAGAPAVRPAPASGASERVPRGTAPAPVAPVLEKPVLAKPVPVAPAAPVPSAPPVAPVPVAPAPVVTPEILPLAQWPQSWKDLLKRGAQRPLLVWTYPALSEDYGGRGNDARRALLKQLLRDLNLPAGSHAFWPLTPPPYDAPATESAHALFFHSGMEALSPQMVVLMGKDQPLLGLPPLSPLVPELFLGRRFVRVADVDVLAQNLLPHEDAKIAHDRRHRHESLVQFLKSQFSALFVGRNG